MTQQSQVPPAAWNNTAAAFDAHLGLADLFRQQALRTPEAVAVRLRGDSLSYRDLHQRSLALAARLRATGAEAGQCIGVGLPRSPDAIVAVLAVLAIGAAYVPLDPAYPRERLALQIEDAGIARLITATALVDQFPLAEDVQMLLVDDLSAQAEAGTEAPAGGSGADLAYVIYTSGSTGRPKGVQIEHRAAVNFTTWVRHALAIGPGDVLLAQASLSFDMSVLDIFVALTSGATIEIVPVDMAQNGRELVGLIARSGATWMQATPSTWRLLVEAGLPPTPGLSAIVGGEALGQSLAEALKERLGAVWNFYGPTETTVYSSAARYEGGRPLIGRPIANTQLHVLDTTGRPVAIGEAGELHIGGAGLARGYMNQPERTAEAFIAASHLQLGVDRLYRTGDLARWTFDGQLEYLGRNDHQVKVRGYRIELGEIESLLLAAPGVRNCAVIARADHHDVQRLLAYVVADDGGGTLDGEALKARLRRQLPEYMVPSAIMTLAALPLTPNQKVDRNALPNPSSATPESAQPDADGALALDPEEQVVADVWSAVLEVPIRSRHADFFEWGGHSLMALVTIMKLEEIFNRAIPLDSLWADGCTVAGMARIVRQLRDEPELSRLVHIRPGRGDHAPLFVVHTARGSVNEYFALAHQLNADHPVIGIRARGVYGEAKPSRSIEGLAADCIEAIREHQPRGPYMVAGFSLGGLIAFEVASQLEAAGDTVRFLGMFDTVAPGFKPYFRLQDRLPWWLGRLRATVSGRRSKPVKAGEDPQLDERGTISPFAKDLQQALLDSIDRYTPSRSYKGVVDIFVVRSTARQAREPTLGWHPWWGGAYQRHLLQSDGHLDIVSPEGAGELARAIAGALGRPVAAMARDTSAVT